MKRSTLLTIFTIVLLLAGATAARAQAPKNNKGRAPQRAAQAAPDPKDLKYPPLNDFKVPEPTRVELANGMIVYLLEDRELPVVNLTALIRAGGRWDPADKIGLAEIAASVMRTGGTTTKTGDQIDEELERIAASVETNAGNDAAYASMSVIKDDIDTGLRVLADVLMNPAFQEEKIDIAKLQLRDQIARRNDDVGGIVDREINKQIYGANSPYARTPEYATVDNITREDLIAFHKRYFHPNNMIVGMWGDFSVDEMKAKLEQYFGKWQRAQLDLPAVPAVNSQPKGRFFFIQKDNVAQSNVAIGHVGGKQSDPDYFSLLVLNNVMGGFGGRFFRNIRSDKGLAYHVGASWNAGTDVEGTFVMTGQTKSESTVEFIRAMLDEIDKLAKQEVTDAELARAKESILNSFIFNFDSKGEVVGRLISFEYYGYPRDFLARYKQSVEKVSKADLLRVAKEYIRPEKFVYVVAGKEEDLGTPLASLGLGEVAKLDITIPEPKAAPVAAATAETAGKGKALMQAALKAAGGDALKQVKDLRAKSDAKLITPQGEFAVINETTIKYPNKVLTKLTLPFGDVFQGYDGQAAWIKSPQGTQDLTGDNLVEFQNALANDTVFLLTHFDSADYQVQFLEQTNIDGRAANVVLVTTPTKHEIRVFIDAENNMIVRKAYRSKAGGAPADNEENYSDFRDVSGLRLPFKRVQKRNGQLFAEATTTEMKVNSGVEDKFFTK